MDGYCMVGVWPFHIQTLEWQSTWSPRRTLHTMSQLATSHIAYAWTQQKCPLMLWNIKGNGYTANIFIMCSWFLCKGDYESDKFIHTPIIMITLVKSQLHSCIITSTTLLVSYPLLNIIKSNSQKPTFWYCLQLFDVSKVLPCYILVSLLSSYKGITYSLCSCYMIP